jgi:hypothetical protein
MIRFDARMQADINGALEDGHPVVVCAVTPAATPAVSLRGTVQTFGDDGLAFWVRNQEASETVRAIAVNPVVAAVYANLPARRHYTMLGRARVEPDAAVRRRVFENSPPPERARDPERTGVAVVVELDSVRGRGAGGPVAMSREA